MTSTSATNGSSHKSGFNKLGSGAKAGVIVGIVAAVFLIVAISWFWCCRGCCYGAKRARGTNNGSEYSSEEEHNDTHTQSELPQNGEPTYRAPPYKQDLPEDEKPTLTSNNGRQVLRKERAAAPPPPPSQHMTDYPATPAPAYSP